MPTHGGARAGAGRPPGTGNKALEGRRRADERRAIAEADIAELKRDELRGSLIRRDLVTTACFEWSRSFRNRVQSLVPQLLAAADAAPDDPVLREKAVRDALDSALEGIADVPERI